MKKNKNKLTPFENYLKILENSWKILNLSEKEISSLQKPNKIHKKEISIKMDNWSKKVFSAYRMQFNNARWIYKWWIRFHPEANESEVMALSALMSIKCAVVNIPFWWWKWWVQCNPKELSQTEIEKVARWWIWAMHEYIWKNKDCPAPDVYTNPQIMAWMLDEFEKIKWYSEPWVLTWKPIEIWWSKWRWFATAQWWIYVLEEYVNSQNLKKDDLKVAVQWFWNAWYFAAKILWDLWYKVVAVSDSRWWIYCKTWLNTEEVMKFKKENKKISWYQNIEKNIQEISNEDLLECDCDILIPAALDWQITWENAEKIKAKIILELANWPTTFEADDILNKNWVFLIPDVLANAWWVTVSYFEWVQNNFGYYWEEDEVLEKLKKIMIKSFWDAKNFSNNRQVSIRSACFWIAIERILKAMKLKWQV